MPKEKGLYEEEDDKMKFLESLVKAICKEKIVNDDAGNPKVKLSTAELRDLVDIETKIMSFKRGRYGH